MYCPQCGFENADGSQFCTSCSENLEIIEKQTEINLKCPGCGCEYIGKGVFSREENLMQYEFKFIPGDSDVPDNGCSNCEYILRLE